MYSPVSILSVLGYPRSLSQAQYLWDISSDVSCIHISLARWVAIKKLSGRRECSVCKKSFNLTDVITSGYYMPAILPTQESCSSFGESRIVSKCISEFTCREDDTEEVIGRRLSEYDEKTNPLLDFFASKGALKVLDVTRGIADTDKLIDLMTK